MSQATPASARSASISLPPDGVCDDAYSNVSCMRLRVRQDMAGVSAGSAFVQARIYMMHRASPRTQGRDDFARALSAKDA
eukprot:4981910-Pyramimonas_sp.AAC.1